MIGPRREEFADQIAFGAHDLDAVIARLDGEPCGRGVICDRRFDLFGSEFGRDIAIDRRLDRRGRHHSRVIAIAPGVQDLQHDAAACRTHGRRDLAVVGHLVRSLERARLVLHAAGEIGREAAGHDQSGAALGAFGIEPAELIEACGLGFKTSVHGSHHDPARQRDRADADRFEQGGVGVRHGAMASSMRHPRLIGGTGYMSICLYI